MDTTINQATNHQTLGALGVMGLDAKKFLQGQLTCNVDEVTEGEFRLGAHCNPQGRIISFFRLFYFDDQYYLVMPEDLLEVASQALKKYAVFFKTTLSIITPHEKIPLNHFSPLADIQAGIPRIHANTSGKFLPHELNLQFINAISFTKGCYTGQEIIARMQYRGQLKNHMYRALAETNTAPTPGQDLLSDNQIVGTVVDAIASPLGVEMLFVANKEIAAKTALKFLPLPYSLS